MKSNPHTGKKIEQSISIAQFINAIRSLPEDKPQVTPGKWYRTQKQHWLGWLGEYSGPGAYGRKTYNRDAKFAYNHIVCPEMLVYLARAIPLRPELVKKVDEAYLAGSTDMAKSGAIRKAATWSEVYQALWGKGDALKTDSPRSFLSSLPDLLKRGPEKDRG